MKSRDNIVKKAVLTVIAIFFWLLVWHFLSLSIHSSIFLPSPVETFSALRKISGQAYFWQTIFNTFGKIAQGFISGVVVGTFLAVISEFVNVFNLLVSPLMRLIKSIPVASFIILALLWIKSDRLSVLISFIMVMPILYINVLQGFEGVDKKLLEMADIFNVNILRKIRFIYIPALIPNFMAACKIGLGFCFKSGIAAEIIGLPYKSIGSELYKAKLYLMTDELFAWTVVIVIMSVFFESICIYLLNKLSNLIEKADINKKIKIKKSETPDKNLISYAENMNIYNKDSMLKKKNIRKFIKNKVLYKKNMNMYGNGDGLYEKKPEYIGDDMISVEKISKSYGGQNVLENVSFKVRAGERMCITGKSGIGKTTLLRIIAGLEKADSGKVIINGNYHNFGISTSYKDKYFTSILHNERHTKCERISMVFQEDRLIENADVYTNIYCAIGRDFDKSEVDKHLKEVGLEGDGNRIIKELSGGMKRRVAIVRCMMKKSEIILLDEPFKGLDSELKEDIINYVIRHLEGRAVIAVTHDMTESERMGAALMEIKEYEKCN